uniref:Transposase domain-containing protein n=1 Tax=Anopheles epiroticus TaxID=199890 RepID=A0A182PWY7_9DIPT
GLRTWAILKNVPRSTVNLLLAVLRNLYHLDVPKDARTLLKTSSEVGLEVQTISGGEFWYQGVETVLQSYFRNSVPENDTFTIQVSIDGLPLYKSSGKQLWPILIWVEDLPQAPVMLAGLFSGVAKPELVDEYLGPLVSELNELQERGLRFGDKVVGLKIGAFIADSPARAFIKATTYFNGKHGCQKCSCVGEHIQPENKIIFVSVDAELRTDAGFRARVDKDHHKSWPTPLEKLNNFNLIENVPTSEELHLLDRGVSKKIVLGLYEGIFENFNRWTPRQKEAVNKFLSQTRLPSEVNRPLRSFRLAHFWKATEWRSFLHYVSIAVLKDFMPCNAFNHFLLYFCSVTIFSSSSHKQLWPLAEKFLYHFVKDFPQYYGRSHMTSNVHNLLHVSGDVAKFGQLDRFSAYRFENYLQILKRHVRSGTRVVAPVAARMQKIASLQVTANSATLSYPRLKDNADNGIIKFLEAKKLSSLMYTIIGIQYESWTEQFNVSVDDNMNGRIMLSSTDIHVYKIKETGLSRMVEVPWYMIK